MSILLMNNVEFDVNRLKTLQNWELNDDGVTYTNGMLVIPPGKKAGTALQGNALYASMYRFLDIRFTGQLSGETNNINKVDVILVMTYIENAETRLAEISANITKLNTTEGSLNVHQKVIACPTFDSSSIKVYIVNRGSTNIEVKSCTLRRSKDLINSNVSEAVNVSISLSRLTTYDNGCIAEFSSQSDKLKIEYFEDENNNFMGVLVNDTRFIPWQRLSGMLPE